MADNILLKSMVLLRTNREYGWNYFITRRTWQAGTNARKRFHVSKRTKIRDWEVQCYQICNLLLFILKGPSRLFTCTTHIYTCKNIKHGQMYIYSMIITGNTWQFQETVNSVGLRDGSGEAIGKDLFQSRCYSEFHEPFHTLIPIFRRPNFSFLPADKINNAVYGVRNK